METSARNVLDGTILEIQDHGLITTCKIQIDDPGTLIAAINREAADLLEISEGDEIALFINPALIVIQANK